MGDLNTICDAITLSDVRKGNCTLLTSPSIIEQRWLHSTYQSLLKECTVMRKGDIALNDSRGSTLRSKRHTKSNRRTGNGSA